MVNLILTTINLAAFLFYLRLLYHVYFLLKIDQNKFYAFFFTFMTLIFTCNTKTPEKNKHYCHIDKIQNDSTRYIVGSKNKKIIMESTLTNSLEFSYDISIDSSNQRFLNSYNTFVSGLEGGIKYECNQLIVNPTNEPYKYEYYVVLNEKLNFLGIEFYTKTKDFHGYFKI